MKPISGWPILVINLILFLASIVFVLLAAYLQQPAFIWGTVLFIPSILLCFGYFSLQPNEGRIMILFGEYRGTVSISGFHWANPFYARARGRPIPVGTEEVSHEGTNYAKTVYRTLSAKVSLRTRNFNSKKLKVNDKGGNPIEIAVVVVWHVEDTAKAAFDVDDFESYVEIQSEGAIRHIASLYNYDHGEEQELTLRGSADEVTDGLKKELQARLDKAGLEIEEMRLIHLAYAPEIAQVMLRRQQAEAVISARRKIVQGAVSMVEMALKELSEKEVVRLDEERKAAMVSNLLVVLCGESEVRPVLNTGTLYT